MKEEKVTEYLILLSDTDRKRHRHVRKGNVIVDFTIQYETFIQGKWSPVVRYDTAHGFMHKDLFQPDGSKEKIVLGSYNYNEGLVFADSDINQNWFVYKEKYLRRVKR